MMDPTALQRRFSKFLAPLSRLYAACMRLRAWRYRSRFLPSPYRAACPVVSVGNIAWGGTGKTPLVDWLLFWAEERGVSAVVLSRGYRAAPPTLPFPVEQDHAPLEAGDEPVLLARRHRSALVLVDPKRPRAAAWAEKNARPQMFILDDGMQHLAMARDVNLVLLRPQDLLEQWDRVIPAGSWREGVSALARAEAFCIKTDPQRFSALSPLIEQRLAPYNAPVFPFHLKPEGIRLLTPRGPAAEVAPGLDGKPYVLASAVGHPEQVLETATDLLGRAPEHHAVHKDHHLYAEQDVPELVSRGLPVVCTAKDAVKLMSLLPLFSGVPVWVLEARPSFGPGLFTRQSFPEWWEERWQGLFPNTPRP